MVKESYQLTDSAVEAYENQKVTAMFGPLARETLDKIPVAPEEVVLDVACGTGIVARTIFDRVKPTQPIAGADVNRGMIEMAKRITLAHAGAFDWQVAGVEALPFTAGKFTLAFCQQGIQYFADERVALTEIRRVMATDGRLVITVWGGVSDFFYAMADSVGRHVNPTVGTKYLAPFLYKNIDLLPGMLTSAGFTDVNVKVITVDRTMANIETSIYQEITGHPAGPEVQAAGEAALRKIADEVVMNCSKYLRGRDMVVPQRAYLIAAKAAL